MSAANFSKISNVKVGEFTTPLLVTLSAEMTLREADELMQEHNVRHLPIINDKKLIGIITDRDLKHNFKFGEDLSIAVSDIMTVDPFVVYEESLLSDVAFSMSEKKIGSALVLNESEELIGIFTSTDALNALIEVLRGEVITL